MAFAQNAVKTNDIANSLVGFPCHYLQAAISKPAVGEKCVHCGGIVPGCRRLAFTKKL
jgi:hypothetical protein